jgi:hypothetical protein
MPHWLIKSAVQRIIASLPAGHRWNTWFAQHVTHSLDLTPDRFQLRVDYCRMHVDHLFELHPACANGFTAIEIGTGWYPVVPIGLYLSGASEIWSFDISPLLEAGRLRATLERFVEQGRDGTLQKRLPYLKADRLQRLANLAQRASQEAPTAVLAELNIHALNRGAQDTGLPPRTIDLFASTGVLEYIPREVLKAILAESRRLGTPNATHSHYLNLVDQYSYFDHSITAFNFLKYSSGQWKYLNSPLTWQNRLRISDFRALFTEGGYVVTKETNTSAPLEELQRVRLAPEFQHYTQNDLRVILSWMVAKPAGS